MAQEILMNVIPQEVRIALLENGILQEVHIERSIQQGVLGNIYKGRVSRLMPGIQSAFIDIGLERSAFLHVSDVEGYSASDTYFDIRDILQPGQELLVQVFKNPLGTKGARLTTKLTLPSRYLVLTPGVFQVAVSQKIHDETERLRLTRLITPGQYGGYVFRTVAEGVTQEELIHDQHFLDTLWQDIQNKSKTVKSASLVYEEVPLILRVVRDGSLSETAKICVDNEEAYLKMRDFALRYVPQLVDRIEWYRESQPLFDRYSIDKEIERALQRKVYLKSGGYLVIDQTEAMTTIDVNSGSHLGTSCLEETILKINLEAVEAIARHVRLRNLGGIIIVDFIDLIDRAHKTHLIESLVKALAKDNVRTEVSELSSLGLVQMTRKRTRESLEQTLCVPCPLCHCRGSIKSIKTVCYDIFRELMRTAALNSWQGYCILAAQPVIDYLMDSESAMIADFEAKLGKPITLRAERSYQQEQYDVLPT